jgi:hypothetical protein
MGEPSNRDRAPRTAGVIVSDAGYWPRARRTIRDIRTAGQWGGTLVLIAVDFEPPADELRADDVTLAPRFGRIDVRPFVEAVRAKPLTEPTCDAREYRKLSQFEKLHVFQPWFAERFDRLFYVDAGLRVVAPLRCTLLALPWSGRFWAPDDTGNSDRTFRCQVETDNWPETLADLEAEYPGLLAERYFLNCVWVQDARLGVTTADLVAALQRWPLWRTNEMGPMNVVLHFARRLWSPLPEDDDWVRLEGGAPPRRLFAWCDSEAGTWERFGLVKYSCTLPFDADPLPLAPLRGGDSAVQG